MAVDDLLELAGDATLADEARRDAITHVDVLRQLHLAIGDLAEHS
jgi:hypothetical protein